MYKTIPDYPDYVAFENGGHYSQIKFTSIDKAGNPVKSVTGVEAHVHRETLLFIDENIDYNIEVLLCAFTNNEYIEAKKELNN